MENTLEKIIQENQQELEKLENDISDVKELSELEMELYCILE